MIFSFFEPPSDTVNSKSWILPVFQAYEASIVAAIQICACYNLQYQF